MSDDIVARLRLSPVLMYSDQLGQSRIDYEACKKFINNEGVKMMREAADEIERLRKERDELQKWKDLHNTFWRERPERRDAMRESDDGIDWKHRALCAEAKLATYKRAYARQCCKNLYASGARWKTRPNPMRDDGVFIEEDCDPGKNRTYFPFPHQFEQDVAEEIVYLLNRATDDREKDGRSC